MTGDERATAQADRRWRRVSYGFACVISAVMGYFLLRIPVQVFDCFSDMMSLQQSMGSLLANSFDLPAYFRPGRWVAQKIVFELAGSDYFYAFRLTQALQVLAVAVLFVRLLEPRTALAASLVPLALTVLTASHTFAWTVREAFPINHFLTILLCSMAAANLVLARPRWSIDVAAAALFVVAAATLESGLLVWVIVAGGYLIGLRGVSRAGVAVVTILLAAYVVARFVVLDVGMPSLTLREAGIGFTRYAGADLQRMFADNPYPFYAYNVLASFVGVLLAEPRDGVWSLTHSIVEGRVHPGLVVNVISSTLATILVGVFVWRRRRALLERRVDRRDRVVLLFLMVLGTNAALSFSYTKDAIMSPAGGLFAAAVYVATLDAIERVALAPAAVRATAVVLLTVLSAGWALRLVGIHATLVRTSFEVREQWASIDEYIPRWRDELSPSELALKRQLQNEAILYHPEKPLIRDEFARLFDTD